MQIDVSEKIETAKRITREWAERAGYVAPESDANVKVSKKANDLRRLLEVSDFGCQSRNVHAILEAVIGETIPKPRIPARSHYANPAPFVVGSVLVPLTERIERPGILVRVSSNGNGGLRLSNGETSNNFYSRDRVRPADDAEIETYFSEFFGLSVNPADLASSDSDEDRIPF